MAGEKSESVVRLRVPFSMRGDLAGLRTLPSHSAMWCELRIEFAIMLTLTGMAVLVHVVPLIAVMLSPRASVRPEYGFEVLVVFSVLVAFVLGTCCAAEEQEHGTAEFTGRLPISRLRLWSEKMLASLIVYWGWLALCVAISISYVAITHSIVRPPAQPPTILALGMLLSYATGLAVGIWIGRVLPALITGAVAGLGFILLVRYIKGMVIAHYAVQMMDLQGLLRGIDLGALCLGWLLLAALFYCGARLREVGRTPLYNIVDRFNPGLSLPRWNFDALPWIKFGRPGFGILWKDARSARFAILALTALIAIAWTATIDGVTSRSNLIFLDAAIYLVGIGLLGISIFPSGELESPRFFLYALPVSRWAILKEKLLKALFGWLVVSQLVWWVVIDPDRFAGSEVVSQMGNWYLAAAIIIPLTGLMVLLLCINLSFYFSNVFLRMGLSFLFCVSVILILDMRGLMLGFSENRDYWGWVLMALRSRLFLIPLLLGWCWYAFCRARLGEMSDKERSDWGGALVVCFLELAYTLFHFRWADLKYLIFG